MIYFNKFVDYIDALYYNQRRDMAKSYMDIYELNCETVHYMLDVDEALNILVEAIGGCNEVKLTQIIDNDINFNRMRDSLEDKCLHLFLKEQHYSRDLRNLLSVFKIITDVERIADQIRDIAENCIGQSFDGQEQILKDFLDMLKRADNMFKDCIKCFGSFDSEQSISVREADDIIDNAYRDIKEIIHESMKNEASEALFALLSAVKHTEKIGDHIANIAEWVQYTVSGMRK